MVLDWQKDEGQEDVSVYDILLDTLATVHKLMRIAFERGEGWLVESLELERQALAAEASFAPEDLNRKYAERGWR